MDLEEVERWERHESPTKAMMELITRLPLHVENWFAEYVIALKQNHCIEALEALDHKLVTAGMESLYLAVCCYPRSPAELVGRMFSSDCLFVCLFVQSIPQK